jgi:ferric-dicitrate binding protein FerR (iron transport regulator)
MSNKRWRDGDVYRAATELAVDESSEEQALRRAARWYAWLKSPECTFQDRENFERWCRDETNAAAYVTLFGDLAGAIELESQPEFAPHTLAPPVPSPWLDANQR